MKKEVGIRAQKRDLRDFTRLVLAFFMCLVALSLYQNISLFASGVLDDVLNKSLLISIIHHLGFTSLLAIFLVFPYKILENISAESGFKSTTLILFLTLILEGLLTRYYTDQYEILGAGFAERINAMGWAHFLSYAPLFAFGIVVLMYLSYRGTARFYVFINRMYPFTIVLFTLFLATLISGKNPVNENKTEHLVYHQLKELLDFNKYEGEEEYPLLKDFEPPRKLAAYFDFKKEAPNFVFIVMDGIGSDFVGEDARYRAFMPFLNDLATNSLYWSNNLSNTGEAIPSISTLFGSLPFGEEGFTNLENLPESYTLFDLLNENGYQTSFYFGGNVSLDNLGKFLYEENVGLISGRKTFGSQYTPQKADAAGISLGYPDGELFRKWLDDYSSTDSPRLDIFLTQSTKAPFLIPSADRYEQGVEDIIDQGLVDQKDRRLIQKNKEVFGSVLYSDHAVNDFMEKYRRKAEFYNTIFIITGSHNLSELPQRDYLDRYRVPLIIYSPLLKAPVKNSSLVAHTDILPEMAGLLNTGFGMKVPAKVSWLGDGLIHKGIFKEDKVIPLFRHRGNLQEYIVGGHCLSGNTIYKIGADLSLFQPDKFQNEDGMEESFREFKAINRYVTFNDKLLPGPENSSIAETTKEEKSDLVWINSVFNSEDFDNAYRTARELAINGDKERALLLCDYILKKVPGHADTEILKGRIYAWNKQYRQAANLLERTVKKYPVYADAYSALLDVYFWSDTNHKALDLKDQMRKHKVSSEELDQKIRRAEEKMRKDQTLFNSENLGYLNFEEDGYE